MNEWMIEGCLQLDRSQHGRADPLDIWWSMEEEPEILAFGQQHGDEGGAPEGEEDEFAEDAGEVEEVG